ncbi:MAG: MDR family MFS transporter [Candidatus Limnocylindrales bacterium]
MTRLASATGSAVGGVSAATSDLVARLTESSDPTLAYRARVLAGALDPESEEAHTLRAAIADSPRSRALLSHREPNGTIHLHPYAHAELPVPQASASPAEAPLPATPSQLVSSGITDDEVAVRIDRRRQFITLGAVMLGMFLGSLDQTIVGTALPKIVGALNGLEHYSWVITGYLVASTAMVPIFGKVSDIYGRKWLYMLGIAVFLAGSILSGQSRSMDELIAFRTLQGLGAGAVIPIAQAIVGDIFPPAERGKYQGLLASVFGVAVIVGPTLGGYITDNLSWRWVFYVNVPFGLLALVAVFLVFPSHTALQRRPVIDWWGSAALIGGVVPLLVALSLGSTQPDGTSTFGWDSPQVLGLLAVAFVLLVAFVLVERHSVEPTLPLDLFGNRNFTASAVITFLTMAGIYGAILYIPLFVQDVLGRSATDSGVILEPMMVGLIVVSILSGQFLSRTGRYKILAILGTAVIALGMYMLSTMTVHTGNNELVRDMVVLGLGLGSSMAIYTIIVQNAFPVERLGVVTASLAFFRSIGGAVGAALLGSVMTNRFVDQLQAGLASLPAAVQSQMGSLTQSALALMNATNAQIGQALAPYGAPGAAIAARLEAIRNSGIADGISEVFMLSAGLTLVALLAAFFLEEIPLRRTRQATAAATVLQASEAPPS